MYSTVTLVGWPTKIRVKNFVEDCVNKGQKFRVPGHLHSATHAFIAEMFRVFAAMIPIERARRWVLCKCAQWLNTIAIFVCFGCSWNSQYDVSMMPNFSYWINY